MSKKRDASTQRSALRIAVLVTSIQGSALCVTGLVGHISYGLPQVAVRGITRGGNPVKREHAPVTRERNVK